MQKHELLLILKLQFLQTLCEIIQYFKLCTHETMLNKYIYADKRINLLIIHKTVAVLNFLKHSTSALCGYL